MISEKTLRDEFRMARKELKRNIRNEQFDEVYRTALYLEFIEFALEWSDDD